MNLFSYESLDILTDWIFLFLFIFICLGVYLFYTAINTLRSIGNDDADFDRINRLLSKIDIDIKSIQKQQNEKDLRVDFLYKKCLDLWQTEYEQSKNKQKE